MKIELFAALMFFLVGCAASRPMSRPSESRTTGNLSQDATECERKAVLAGPGNKASAFDSCMRAKGHTTSR